VGGAGVGGAGLGDGGGEAAGAHAPARSAKANAIGASPCHGLFTVKPSCSIPRTGNGLYARIRPRVAASAHWKPTSS
jgi:hypothetical protein